MIFYSLLCWVIFHCTYIHLFFVLILFEFIFDRYIVESQCCVTYCCKECDSVIHADVPFHILFHDGLSQATEQFPVLTGGPRCSSIQVGYTSLRLLIPNN